MGLVSSIISMFFGGSAAPKDDFGPLQPNDLEGYWGLRTDIADAERVDTGARAAVLARHGIRDVEHWERISATFLRLHGMRPEFALASSKVSFLRQFDDRRDDYRFPPELLAPIDGIGLDQLAITLCTIERDGPAAAPTLHARLGVDAHRFARASEAWMQRMRDGRDPISSSALDGLWHCFLEQARAMLRAS